MGTLYSTNSQDNVVGAGVKAVGEDTQMAEAHANERNIQYFVGTNALHYRRPFMEIENPLEDGLGILPPSASLPVLCHSSAAPLIPLPLYHSLPLPPLTSPLLFHSLSCITATNSPCSSKLGRFGATLGPSIHRSTEIESC